MSLFKIGGYRWSSELVQWGSPGKGQHKFCGYDRRRGDGQAGAMSKTQIASRTVDVRDVEAVYALFQGQTLLYIGEGNLGARLVAHYRDDEYVGRWDSFTWVSPWQVKRRKRDPHAQYLSRPAKTPVKISAKQLIEHVETLTIRLAEPLGNRQNPSGKQHITWLTQIVPSDFLTQEEKLNRVLKLVEDISAQPR